MLFAEWGADGHASGWLTGTRTEAPFEATLKQRSGPTNGSDTITLLAWTNYGHAGACSFWEGATEQYPLKVESLER